VAWDERCDCNSVASVTWAETRALVADFEASLFKGGSALGGVGGGRGEKINCLTSDSDDDNMWRRMSFNLDACRCKQSSSSSRAGGGGAASDGEEFEEINPPC